MARPAPKVIPTNHLVGCAIVFALDAGIAFFAYHTFNQLAVRAPLSTSNLGGNDG
jgi:hypothetical protein